MWLVKKKKVKCTLVQALRLCTGCMAHRGSRGIALPFHDHVTRRGWGVSVTPRSLFTPGKTRYSLYRRPGGPQGRSGQVQKISPPQGFDPRTIQPIASRYTDWATQPTKEVDSAHLQNAELHTDHNGIIYKGTWNFINNGHQNLTTHFTGTYIIFWLHGLCCQVVPL